MTSRFPSLVHPTSKSGAKKRLIATHAKLESSITPSNQRKRQFLIATKNRFSETLVPTPRRSQIAGRLSQPTRRDPRICADLIANGILERFVIYSKQITGTSSNREKNRARFWFTNHNSRLTNHESRHLRHLRLNFPLYPHSPFGIVIAFLPKGSARQRPRDPG